MIKNSKFFNLCEKSRHLIETTEFSKMENSILTKLNIISQFITILLIQIDLDGHEIFLKSKFFVLISCNLPDKK